MKFGVNTWVWVSPLTTQDLEKLAPHVVELGFDWIELPIEGLNDFDYARAAEIIRQNNLGVSVVLAMGPDRDLIHPDASIRENGAAYIRHVIDAAQTIGATNVVGPIYSAVGRTWQQTPEERKRDMDILIPTLKSLAAYAQERGVVLCLEPLNRFETSFINLASQAIEVVDSVGSPSLQIMLDTFHMNIEEPSLGDAIRAVGPRLHHVHTCENDRGAPGSGHVPWSEVAQALKDIKYNGPLVIESFTDKVKSIARAAAIWRPLASSQDALAKEGVAFLKKIMA
jgi:D-psicose/D-tagatose/L-ribulose 3-epimerase